MQIPRVLATEVINDTFFKLRCDKLLFEEGAMAEYFSVDMPTDAVVVFPLFEDGSFLFNLEYRHPVRSFVLSCPGGFLDDINEDPLQAATRELIEETGYVAEKYTLLNSCYPYPAISSQKIYIVTASGLKKQQPAAHLASELIKLQIMSKEELKKWMAAGKPVDALLLAALSLWTMQ